MKLYPSSMKC